MSEQKTTTRVQVTVEVIDHQPWAPDCVVGTILGREPLGVGRRVPEAAMTLADYLASEAAREDVRKTIDKWPLHPLGNEWRWTIESEGQWVRLSVWSMWADGYPKGAEASAYYRPDGDRYVVTDLGEGWRQHRLRTGRVDWTAEIIAACDYNPYIVDTGERATAGDCENLILKASDLPDAICRVMLASLRVAQS